MLTTNFLGTPFKNPLVLASGIMGVTAASMKNVVEHGAGGVTVKSLSLTPRTGHPNPTQMGTKNYYINAVGLSNPGVEAGVEELKLFKKDCGAPLIGSIFAGTPDEFAEAAEKICAAPIDWLEIDVSCPNVSREFGDPFAYSIPAIEQITKKVIKRTQSSRCLLLERLAARIMDGLKTTRGLQGVSLRIDKPQAVAEARCISYKVNFSLAG